MSRKEILSKPLLMGGGIGFFEPITFNPSTNFQTWKVPAGVTKIHVDCVASKGPDPEQEYTEGYGGRVQCDLTVTPNQVLYIMVGNVPSDTITASYNASDIRTNNAGVTDTTSLQSRLVVAGGGGGCGYGNKSNTAGADGGNGGGLVGEDGTDTSLSTAGKGGTQSAGGAAGSVSGGNEPHQGIAGSFGLGANASRGPGNYNYTHSGMGGSGWYGGGSGAVYEWFGTTSAGGGGGSSYTHPTLCSNVTHTQGYRNGSGYITISMI